MAEELTEAVRSPKTQGGARERAVSARPQPIGSAGGTA
jgi:hypothetical protein